MYIYQVFDTIGISNYDFIIYYMYWNNIRFNYSLLPFLFQIIDCVKLLTLLFIFMFPFFVQSFILQHKDIIKMHKSASVSA